MRANNVISVIGKVFKEPEMKYISADKVVTTFSVAVNKGKDSNGNYVSDWFKCEFWGKQAELVGEMVKVGSMVSVVGSCHVEKWEQNGVKRESVKIRADAFEILGSKNNTQANQTSQNKGDNTKIDEFEDDDIPPF